MRTKFKRPDDYHAIFFLLNVNFAHISSVSSSSVAPKLSIHTDEAPKIQIQIFKFFKPRLL